MINELQKYHEEQQAQLKIFLENELKKFKDANNEYLSQVIAQACENAHNLFKKENKKALERFEKAKNDLDKKRRENYPVLLIKHMEESAKKNLKSSLEFNKSYFENSLAYYKKQLHSQN